MGNRRHQTEGGQQGCQRVMGLRHTGAELLHIGLRDAVPSKAVVDCNQEVRTCLSVQGIADSTVYSDAGC
jgi:hypothetical protein